MDAGGLGGGGLLEPGAALERLEAWKGRIDQVAADTKTMSDRLAGLRVTVADGNGVVEVTVDSAGVVVDLRLGRRIQRLAPDVTARTIMDTIREARTKIADESQEIIAETVGVDSAAGRAIADRVGQQLRDSGPGSGPESGTDERDQWRGR